MKMKTKSVLNDGYKSIVDNGRNQAFVTDLPQNQNGTDMGATALEVAVMSFAGCVSTIYKVVANKMRLTVDKIVVDMDAEKGTETIEKVDFKVNVWAQESEEKLQKCLDQTLKSCPVGVLFRKAGVYIQYSLIKN